jgi:soluble lytic murein transglycosylase-like protein
MLPRYRADLVSLCKCCCATELKVLLFSADLALVNPIWVLTAIAAFGQNAAISQQEASIALQRDAVRKQAASARAWLVPWDPAPELAVADCDPIPEVAAAPLIESAAKNQKIDPKLLNAVIQQESAFRPCAISSKGALGLAQLMPATVKQLDVRDPFDPKDSIDGGAKFLKQLLDRYQGDLPQALGAYNAGPGAVDQAGGVPDIPETRGYVDAILQKLGITRTVPPNNPKPKPTGN